MNERELELLFKIRNEARRELDGIKKSLGSLRGIVARAKMALAGFGKGLVGLGKTALRAATSFKALAVALAAFLSIRAVTGVFRRLIDDLDSVAKLSKELNISIKSLSAFKATVGFAGVESENFTQSLRKLSVAIGQARDGNAEFVRTFRDLGVEIGGGRQTDQVLFDLADQMAAIPDAAERARLAAKLFGEDAGPKMLNLLSQGSAGLRGMIAEADKFGVIVGAKAAANAERFNDALLRVKLAIRGVVLAFTGDTAGSLSKLLNGIAEAIAMNRDRIVDFIKTAIKPLIEASKFLANALALIFQILTGTANELGKLQFENLAERLKRTFSAFFDWLKTALANVIIDAANFAIERLPERLKAALGISRLDRVQGGGLSIQDELGGLRRSMGSISEMGPLSEFFSQFGGEGEGGGALASALKQVQETAKETRNLFAEMQRGISDAVGDIKTQVLDLATSVQGLAVGAFQSLQSSAVGAVESILNGSKSAGEAFKDFGRAILATLINVAAQLIVLIPLFLLFNVLTGGALAASGAASTAVSVGSIGGMAAGSLGVGLGANGGGGQVLVNQPQAIQSTQGRGQRGGATVINHISAMDAQSFREFLGRPQNTKALGDILPATTRTRSVREAFGAPG